MALHLASCGRGLHCVSQDVTRKAQECSALTFIICFRISRGQLRPRRSQSPKGRGRKAHSYLHFNPVNCY